ncbi:fibronectin type III domain-containing protein [Neotamlana laminarinivorans]|uniref:Fibronectin type-III domain-containing protein n=1 Tax=Neotamlana laminarinivorans TaxID=2883124 RepID=A0A9X1L2I5_9FLAO|nr:hypothetical protein [Tamlana laminarinivorans]MCB4797232.1 hypothetical protein [Tamlana laminarinivorans]
MKYKVLNIIIIFVCISCDDIIEVSDISNQRVNILAPKSGTVIETTTVNFSWEAIIEAESYNLQIATPSFSNAQQILLDSLVTTTSFEHQLDYGDYQWRVRAENSAYQTAYTEQSFSVDANLDTDISEEEVVLLSPADNVSYGTTDTINFSWETVQGADEYVFQIATPNFDSATEIIENQTQTSLSFTASNLSEGSYQWRVKAVNTDFETLYTTYSFTIED